MSEIIAANRGRLHRWLAGNADDQVLRCLLRVLLLASIVVLGVDLWGITQRAESEADAVRERTEQPVLPDTTPLTTDAPANADPRRRDVPARHADGALATPMTFSLGSGGRLIATGTIAPGTAAAFKAEIEARGEYIKTLVLNSPGGSVSDALEIGQLARARGLATEVEAGRICVSSCPLVFAGGVRRSAGANAVIGVHQVFALDPADAARRDAMSEAQRVSARCERYLADMGVNLKMWVHAMETPKDRLFIFSAIELRDLNIVTAANAGVAASGATLPADRKGNPPSKP